MGYLLSGNESFINTCILREADYGLNIRGYIVAMVNDD